MNSFLLGSASFILLTVALGMIVVLRRREGVNRLMAAQLLGTGGVAVLLLLAVATENPATEDVALMFALLAAFAAVGFVRDAPLSRYRDESR